MKKVILITGTSSGFGYQMAEKIARSGHQVVATMRDVTGKNIEPAQDLSKLENVTVLDMDVSDSESVKTAVAEVLERFKKVDVVINNAGIQGSGLLEGYSIEQFHKFMDVNLYGVLRVYNELLPSMRKAKDGLIINIASYAGRISPPFQIPYNASKFAIEAVTEGGYTELIVHGIETVMIEPGPFLTEMYSKQGVDADKAEIEGKYGEDTAIIMSGYGVKLGGALQKYQPQPSDVADAALALIEMEKGTRPLRTTVDPIAQGLDAEYNKLTEPLKRKLNAQYFS
jgi:NAD(P)-dependent dehydrogenase (short-subunit alcohol dehydrogenase family)